MHNAIKDGRLKFGDKIKSQMKIDLDPLKVADDHYTEPSIVNMFKASEGHDKSATVTETTEGFNQETNITKATEGLRVKLQKLKIINGTAMEVNMVEESKETRTETD